MGARYKGLVGADGDGVLRAIPEGDTGAEPHYLDQSFMQGLPRVVFVASGKYEEITHPAETEHPRWQPDPVLRAQGVGYEREERVEGIQHGHYELAGDGDDYQPPRRPWEATP